MKNFLRILYAVLGLVSGPAFAQSIGQLTNGQVWGNASGSTGPASGYTIQQMIGATGFTSLPINGCTIGANVLCTSGTASIFSSSTSAFAVGLTGATNPAFQIDSLASQAAGLKVTGAVTGGTVAVTAIDSGSNTNLTLNAKGTGTIGIGSVSTGAVTITPNVTHTGTTTLSSALTYGGVALSNAVTGTGNMVLSTSPSFAFGTGSSNSINYTSANTGFQNYIQIANSGTIGTSGTNAAFRVNLTGGANTYLDVIVGGGTTPNAQIILGNGLTGGFSYTTAAGTVTFPSASGDTLVGRATTDTLTNKTLTSPVLTTPSLGAATATSINGNTFTAGSYTLTGTAAKTLNFTNTLTLTGTDSTTMTFPSSSATITQTIASGTSALGTGAISSAACATVVTTTATNTATTDVVTASFNGDPTAVTGYIPSTSGMLTIIAYPTANNVNFKVCNNTTASITPGAITLNWRVTR